MKDERKVFELVERFVKDNPDGKHWTIHCYSIGESQYRVDISKKHSFEIHKYDSDDIWENGEWVTKYEDWWLFTCMTEDNKEYDPITPKRAIEILDVGINAKYEKGIRKAKTNTIKTK